MTDKQGAEIRRASYFPWGQDRGVEGYRPKREFNFKERDAQGFYDFGARIYNPITGRWLSPDTSIKDGLNRYAYARNNPWTHTDPTGHNTEPAWYWIYSWSPLLERYEVYLWPVGLPPPPGYDRMLMQGGGSSGVGGRGWQLVGRDRKRYE
jgi:RHS repeat-associated protein